MKTKHYSKIKTLAIFIILLTNYKVALVGQTLWQCTFDASSDTLAIDNYATPCNLDYLRSFVPDSTDPSLVVEVTVWMFKNDNGNGFWSGDSSDAAAMLARISSLYSNLQPANLNAGAANISNAKISFHLKSFHEVHDSMAYTNQHYRDSNYYDPNSINFYFATNGLSNVLNPPNNKVHYNTDKPTNICCDGDVYPNDNHQAEAHEMGHALGLKHTKYEPVSVNGPLYNGTSYIETGENCCPKVFVDDVALEQGGVWAVFGGCNDPNRSNNIMGYNQFCRQYFSPLQMAVMHYHLRTTFKNMLTASSYNNDLARNPNLDVEIQSNQIWYTNRYFKGNITVKSGNRLWIHCKVAMAKGTYIIVEKNAQLIVDFDGEITNISGQLWGGILVEGTSNLGQQVNNTTFHAPNHGVVRILNQGKVSQAENGVKNYLTDSTGNIDWSRRGGVIICENAIFENNKRDVEFISYQSPLGNDRSMFKSCTFRTDSNFNSTSPPYAHVSMWNTKGIQFNGCTFEHLAGDKFGFDHGRGIHSIDAIYSVDKNGTTTSKFNNLSWGVLVGNTNPLKVVNIQNSEFTDCEVDAVYLKNMNNAIFNNNIVNIPYHYASTGLYLHTCKNYQVKNNSFEETPAQQFKYNVGVYAYNSQAGSHQIYNNLFSNLEQGISAIANNSGVQNMTDGLKMNCNDFVSGSSNKYDIAMLNYFDGETVGIPATVMQIQGQVSGQNIPTSKLVRNRYGANSACSNCENQWYIQGSAAKGIDHGTNAITTANTHPIPQPQYSDIAVNDQAIGPDFNVNQCPVNPGTNGGVNPTTSKLAALNEYLSYLYENNIEGEDNLFFDIQATLSEKMNYFASDTLPESADSLISLITNHSAYLTDPDLLLIYAYMNKGNYTEAENLANNLGTNRSAWKAFLLKLIEVYEEDDMIFSLTTNTANASFFEAYALNDTLDGQAASQALLNFVLNSTFTEPRLHPAAPGSGSYRLASRIDSENLNSDIRFKVYPNPTENGVFIEYLNTKDLIYYIEIKDLTGRVLFTKFVGGSSKEYLPLKDFSNGLYLIGIHNKKGCLLQSTKFVKQE
jgi:hypothetical protein